MYMMEGLETRKQGFLPKRSAFQIQTKTGHKQKMRDIKYYTYKKELFHGD